MDSVGLQGGIQGDIFHVDLLQGGKIQTNDLVAGYAKGIDTFDVDENNKHSWVANGHDDLVPNILRALYRRSGIHNSAINIKTALIQGSELEFTPLEEYYKKDEYGFYQLVEQAINEADKQRIVKESKLLSKNLNVPNFYKAVSNQLAIYGGYYRFSSYILGSDGNIMLRRLFSEDNRICRLGSKRTSNDGEFESKRIYLSDDFQKAVPYSVIGYKDFQNGERNKVFGGELTFVDTDFGNVKSPGVYGNYIGNMTAYRDYYGTPDYESLDALTYAEIDYMISQHDYEALRSNFSVDSIIIRYRNPEPTKEKEDAKRKEDLNSIQNNFKGSTGKRSMVMWAKPHTNEQGSVETPELLKVIEIPHNNNAERFNILREERLVKLLSAHNLITPELIGLPNLTNSGFSSQSELLITAQEVLFWNSIKPMQDIITSDLEKVFMNSGLPVKISVKRSAAQLKQITTELMKLVMGTDEIRGSYGLAQVSEEVSIELEKRLKTQTKTNTDGVQ